MHPANVGEYKDDDLTRGIKPVLIDFKEQEPLIKEYADNNYWGHNDINILGAQSIDDLLVDYE